MDMEKVIKALECRLDINGSKYKHCLNCDYRHDIDHCQWACQTDGILEDALALLKAEKPIAPNHVEDGNYENSGIMNYWFMCGKCGSCVDPGDKYCRECGQAVKWE